MSEATCGGAQRNHTSVAGGDCTERQKPLKSKDFSRRQIPLQSRESPVRIGPGTPCLTKAPNLSRIFSFMEAPHFREVAPGDRGPASQDDAAAAPSLIYGLCLRSSTSLPLMSEATCGGAQRNHTSVAGGDCTEIQKSLKGKDFSRRQIPLQSRESPVRIGPGTPCLTKAPNLSRIFSFMEAPHFREVAPGDRGPASQDGAAAAPSLINNFRSTTPLPLMSEATCGGAQRNHTSVAGGEFSERQKSLKSKGLSRRPMPLQSRESPVRVNHTSVAGGEFSERQKSLKSKGLSRRPMPLQSRESPGRIGPGAPCLTKAPNLSSIFCFIKVSYFCVLTPGNRGPATHRSRGLPA